MEAPAEMETFLSQKTLEKQLGRKLKLKERIGLAIVKKTMRKNPNSSTRQGAETHKLAIWSLVLGILGLLFIGFGILLSIGAIILGVIALKRIQEDPLQYKGKGLAIAGVLLGSLTLILIITFLIVLVLTDEI